MNRRNRSGGNPSDHIHHALVYVSGICFMVLSFKMQFFGGDISSLQYFSGWSWYLDHDWRNVKTQESKKKISPVFLSHISWYVWMFSVKPGTNTKNGPEKEKLLVICCSMSKVAFPRGLLFQSQNGSFLFFKNSNYQQHGTKHEFIHWFSL